MVELTGGAINDQVRPRRAISQMAGATVGARLRQAAWRAVGQRLFRVSFHNWYTLRNTMLRLCGAELAPTARVRPTVRISHPYNLTIGDHSTVGDHAVLNCLGPITIGKRCTLSQYSHICAAGHDYSDPAMPLVTDPITIGNDVWIASDVFVGPGASVGDEAVVGSRSTVMHDVPAKKICAGDNARPVADRVLRGTPAGEA